MLTYKGELVNATEGDKRDAIKETGLRFFFPLETSKVVVSKPTNLLCMNEVHVPLHYNVVRSFT